MKVSIILALVMGVLSTQAVAQIAEGELPPMPALAASLRNSASRPPDWASLRQFLEQDSSNRHAYKEGAYDCKHFSAELFRRAQSNGMACYVVLIRFAETPAGHSVVCFPTLDKGDVYMDFTPLVVQGKQVPMKSIAMLSPGQPRIQVPLEQIPEAFTNDAAFFGRYQEAQSQLHEAAALLAGSQQEISELQEKIETIQRAPKLSGPQRRQFDQLTADYAEKYRRYQDALAIYRSYEKDQKSPFDTSQVFTVVNMNRF